ncbi:MAG: hypothetical protein ACLP1X_25235 [Polyangiaceae bacterium]
MLLATAFSDGKLLREIRGHVDRATCPVFLDLLCATEPWFVGVSEETVERLVETMTDGEFDVLREGERRILTRIHRDAWDSLKRDLLEYLRQNIGLPREDVEMHVSSVAHAARAPELTGLLRTFLQPRLHYALRPGDGAETLAGVGVEGRNLAATVLMEAEGPLHVLEITRRVSALRGEQVARGAVARWLTDLDARLFGPGTYGLESHISREVKQKEILQVVDELLRGEGSDRQWHVWEIFDAIVAEQPALSEGLDPYILNMLMRRLPSESYEYHGRFVWTTKGRGLDERQRIDVADAFVAALLAAGRPLSTEELHVAVSKARGLHPQIVSSHDVGTPRGSISHEHSPHRAGSFSASFPPLG